MKIKILVKKLQKHSFEVVDLIKKINLINKTKIMIHVILVNLVQHLNKMMH